MAAQPRPWLTMDVLLIVAPVFGLIVIGYVAASTRLLSEAAHRGLSEFAFGIAVPALLLRTIATATFPETDPVRLWIAYYSAVGVTWLLALAATKWVIRRPAGDGVTIAMGAVYGNIVMLGIPLALAAFGPQAAGPMALILAVNTPILWLVGTFQIGWSDRDSPDRGARRVQAILGELARNPIVLGIAAGGVLKISELGLHPVVDKALALVAQAGVPTSLVALGASLRRFRIEGQVATLTGMCSLKLVVMPLAAWWLAFEVMQLPPVAAGVVVLFAAMPAGANVYLFASRYHRVVESVSGAIALGTLISALTVSALIGAILQRTG